MSPQGCYRKSGKTGNPGLTARLRRLPSASLWVALVAARPAHRPRSARVEPGFSSAIPTPRSIKKPAETRRAFLLMVEGVGLLHRLRRLALRAVATPPASSPAARFEPGFVSVVPPPDTKTPRWSRGVFVSGGGGGIDCAPKALALRFATGCSGCCAPGASSSLRSGRTRVRLRGPSTRYKNAPLVARRFRIWWRGWDSNPRRAFTLAGFQDQCIQPLCHPSGDLNCNCFPKPFSAVDGRFYEPRGDGIDCAS